MGADDVILFFEKYDKERSRMLTYSAFCDAFAPKDEQFLKELSLRVPRNINLQMSYDKMFSENTKMLYVNLWNEIILGLRETEILKKKL